MSDLTERYLAAVARELPVGKRADIVAELRDLIMHKLEDREEETGHPPTRAEEEAVLKDLGHPFIVAGGYRRFQHLIGPEIYPFYVFWLKVVLGVVAAVYLAGFFLFLIGVRGPGLERLDGSLLEALLVSFAAVTLVAAATERGGGTRKLVRDWKPSKLPAETPKALRSRFETAFETVFVAGFALWWAGVFELPAPDTWSGEFAAKGEMLTFAMAPIWSQLHTPILIFLVVQAAINIVDLARPDRPRISAALRILWHAASLGLFALLLQADRWVTVSGTAPSVSTLQANFDRGFYIGIWIGIVIAVFEIIRSGWRIVKVTEARRVGVTPSRRTNSTSPGRAGR